VIRTLDSGDPAGIAVAAGCALHCLAAPILGATLPIAEVVASERTELVLLGSSLLISGTTVVASCLRRRARPVVWRTFAIGASLLLTAKIGSERVEPFELLLVVGGAGMIVTTHVINLVYCRCREEGPPCVEIEL
jgi:hypothetical protein